MWTSIGSENRKHSLSSLKTICNNLQKSPKVCDPLSPLFLDVMKYAYIKLAPKAVNPAHTFVI